VGELADLAGADVLVDPAQLELDEASAAELEAAPQTVKRNLVHLRAYAERPPEGKQKAIRLRFLVSPVAILGDDRVEAIELVRNELVDGRAVPTGEHETVPCGIVFRSVGYRGTPVAGVPFDPESCTVPNRDGRVVGDDGAPLRGVYCAGWIKRGPSGVIGTNKKDAAETVELLVADARAGTLERGADAGSLDALLEERGVRVVTQDGWEAIDVAERSAGEPHGRPRVKLAEWDALLEAAGLDAASR
jgi:ferredoxin--NADP+ reductase